MNRRTFTSIASGLALLILVLVGIWVIRLRANPSAAASAQPKQQSTAPVLIEFAATATPIPDIQSMPPVPFLTATTLPGGLLSPTPAPPPTCTHSPEAKLFSPQPNQVMPMGQEIQLVGCAKGEHISKVNIEIDGQIYASLSSSDTVQGVSDFPFGIPINNIPWTPAQPGPHDIQLVVFAAPDDKLIFKSERLMVLADGPEYQQTRMAAMQNAGTPMPTNCVINVTQPAVFMPAEADIAAIQFTLGVSVTYTANCPTIAHIVAFRIRPDELLPTCEQIVPIPDNRPNWVDQDRNSLGLNTFTRSYENTDELGNDRLLVRLQVFANDGSNAMIHCDQRVWSRVGVSFPTITPLSQNPVVETANAVVMATRLIPNSTGPSEPIATPVP